MSDGPPPAEPAQPPEPGPSMEALERRMLRVRIARDLFQMVVFAVAAVWAVWTFWFQTQAAREREVPSLVLTAKLEVLERSPEAIAVRASLRSRNIGRGRARLGAYVLNLTGATFDPEALAAGPVWDAGAEHWRIVPGVPAERTPLASTGDVTDGSFLEPNDEYEETRVLLVPPDRFDLLELHWIAFYSLDQRSLKGCLKRSVTDAGVRLEPAIRGDARCTYSTSDVTTQEVLRRGPAR